MLQISNYRYTKSEQQLLLNSMEILIDTREKSNNHITDYLDRKEVKYKSKKLEFGDYSFMLPANKTLGIVKDIYFNNEISIERKANLEELSNNFTHDRTQFENELIRSTGSKLILMIENAAGYRNIIEHNYRTQYKSKSFLATLHSFKHRYNMDTVFIEPELAGNFIFYSFYYWLRENIK